MNLTSHTNFQLFLFPFIYLFTFLLCRLIPRNYNFLRLWRILWIRTKITMTSVSHAILRTAVKIYFWSRSSSDPIGLKIWKFYCELLLEKRRVKKIKISACGNEIWITEISSSQNIFLFILTVNFIILTHYLFLRWNKDIMSQLICKLLTFNLFNLKFNIVYRKYLKD